MDPRACGVAFRAVLAADRLGALEPTSALAGRRDEVGRTALVALNADFFRSAPWGVPEGPQVSGGEVVAAAGSYGAGVAVRFGTPQPVFGITSGGAPFVGETALAGAITDSRGERFPLARVNAPPGEDSLALLNRFARFAPPESGRLAAHLAITAPAAAVGDTARGVVVGIDTLWADPSPSADQLVLVGRGRAAEWLRGLGAGDTLVWVLEFTGSPDPVRELVGGFPLLIRGGEPVFRALATLRSEFADERHPRSAVALRADGTVLLVAVDGRQPGYSDGMTLDELTRLLQELGATEALNLDGGGSTTLVVAGRVANQPSDAEGERPVANALLVYGAAPGDCRGGGDELGWSTTGRAEARARFAPAPGG